MNHSEPSGGPLLSVVMPVHNEADYVGDTLRALRLAVTDANLDDDMELIIVDDGSTDESATVAESTWGKDLSLLTQPNRGRFESRRRGMAAAHGRHVLALDARSVLEVGSLAFWTEQRDRHPGRRLWNGDTRIQSDVNPYARFWEVLTGIGWGEYTRNPRLVSFGAADFDRFPKGTGMFLAPREAWLAAYRAVEARNRGSLPRHLVSDDTALLRHMVEDGELIWIAPEFAAEYVSPRRTLAAFVENAYYRGGTFVDSYYESPSGLGRIVRAAPTIAALGALACWFVLLKYPKRAGLVASVSAVAPGAVVATAAAHSGDSVSRSMRIGALTLPFMAAFVPGLIRGYVARWLPGRR